MDLKDKYKDIARYNPTIIKKVDTFVPSPNDIDYIKGYIKRFFVQKSNDDKSPIYEVSSNNFKKYSNSDGFKGVTIRWRISGPIEMTFKDDSSIADKGVRESNRVSIDLVSDKMPALKLYLVHLLQFHKK